MDEEPVDNENTEENKPDFRSKNSQTIEDNKPIDISVQMSRFDINKIPAVGLK